MTPDQAASAAHALYVKSGGALRPHPERDRLIAEADALLRRWLAVPQLLPRKREPEAYCFRCGAPVPGGLFIGNHRAKGRGFSWVNADGMSVRNPATGEVDHTGHACPRKTEQVEFLDFEERWSDDEREIVERYATSEAEAEDYLEESDPDQLPAHLTSIVQDLDHALPHLRGPEQENARDAREQALADLERLGYAIPAQLEMFA